MDNTLGTSKCTIDLMAILEERNFDKKYLRRARKCIAEFQQTLARLRDISLKEGRNIKTYLIELVFEDYKNRIENKKLDFIFPIDCYMINLLSIIKRKALKSVKEEKKNRKLK